MSRPDHLNRSRNRTPLSPVSTAAVLIFSCWPGSMLQAAPLTNGDAELGNLDGWAASSTQRIQARTSLTQSTGTVYPQDGNWFFAFAAAPGSYETLEQTGDMETGTNSLRLTGAFQSERLSDVDNDDFGEAVLQGLDGTGTVVAEASSGTLLAAQTLLWETFSVNLLVPASAVQWRIELRGTLRFGSFINVFYDNLALSFSNDLVPYEVWAANNIPDPAKRDPAQDPDKDGYANLVEYACFLDPMKGEAIPVLWLKRGSEVSENDVDLFFRESLTMTGVTREFLHNQTLGTTFSPISGRGPYVHQTGTGYSIKRLRIENLTDPTGFFRLRFIKN